MDKYDANNEATEGIASVLSRSFSRDDLSQENDTCICFPFAFFLLLLLPLLFREIRCCEQVLLILNRNL